VEDFADLWYSLAGHFASHGPNRLFLKIMNERE